MSLDGDRRGGATREAMTRSPDLLHGKQSVQPSEAGFLPAKAHDLGTAALGAMPADPVEYGGVYVTNS